MKAISWSKVLVATICRKKLPYCSSKNLFICLFLSVLLKVVTGGLDSKIVKWDFNRGRPLQVVDLGKSFVSKITSSFARTDLISVRCLFSDSRIFCHSSN